MLCRMSTKCSEDEISCKMSTTATRWSRSFCSSATRLLSRANSSSGANFSGGVGEGGLVAGDRSLPIAVRLLGAARPAELL